MQMKLIPKGKCVRELYDVLWMLDGHYDVLPKQSCHVPCSFSSFRGYNCPQKHKHHKRQISNLDYDVLRYHSFSLFDLLHTAFWSWSKWQELSGDVQYKTPSTVNTHAAIVNI